MAEKKKTTRKSAKKAAKKVSRKTAKRAKKSVAALTRRLAAELETEGITPEVVAETPSGSGLAEALASRARAAARFLLPRAEVADSRLPDRLRELGGTVTEVVAYRTTAPGDLTDNLKKALDGGVVSAIAFASPSAVTNLLAALDGPAREALLEGPRIACIGPTTAAAARENGFTVHAVPDRATTAELAAAVLIAVRAAVKS